MYFYKCIDIPGNCSLAPLLFRDFRLISDVSFLLHLVVNAADGMPMILIPSTFQDAKNVWDDASRN
jgi:hypothetical protein